MDDERKMNIINAAIQIIGVKGYTKAKIHDISEEAGVASGLIYSPNFFKNKLDLLLSIVLGFWKTLNDRIEERVKPQQDPVEQLDEIVAILEEFLIKTKHSIYLSKVVHESLPHIYSIKDDELAGKREEITKENRKLLNTIDEIIKKGQEKGDFDNTFKPGLMRQVLYGAFEFLAYGIYLKIARKEPVFVSFIPDIRLVCIDPICLRFRL